MSDSLLLASMVVWLGLALGYIAAPQLSLEASGVAGSQLWAVPQCFSPGFVR